MAMVGCSPGGRTSGSPLQPSAHQRAGAFPPAWHASTQTLNLSWSPYTSTSPHQQHGVQHGLYITDLRKLPVLVFGHSIEVRIRQGRLCDGVQQASCKKCREPGANHWPLPRILREIAEQDGSSHTGTKSRQIFLWVCGSLEIVAAT